MRRPLIAALLLLGVACRQPAADPAGAEKAVPVYNKQTGRLEQLQSDRNGDGKIDTWAHMDGARLLRIEVDRNGDGRADRFEHYDATDAAGGGRGAIQRIEEAAGPGDQITRREFYRGGIIDRVEEDTDLDGRVDKWEHYEGGNLIRLDLDLQGRGVANQRLFYRDGTVVRVESDPDGDGVFTLSSAAGKGSE